MKIDLSEFLPKKDSLDEFLPKEPELPKEVLSPPEVVVVHWLRQTCSCSRVYESEEHNATIRHTISRRIGFGLRPIGKVYIPLLPNLDISDLPVEVHTTEKRIFSCPSCIGTKPSLPLFPDQPPAFLVSKSEVCASPHVMAWQEMHKTAPLHAKEEALAGMARRKGVDNYGKLDFDDLLSFRTTKVDLKSAFSDLSTVDPEE